MSDHTVPECPPYLGALSGPRRPRIALMGEFSAGKSTLANLMIGTDPLPMQVVATRLPPVWIRYGADEAAVVDIDGNETARDLNSVGDLDPEKIAFITLQRKEQILKRCDIIDMPGISDPNMSNDVWARIMPVVDGVVWCSPATQAWRQSEASAWSALDETLHRHSMLLLTRADMLHTDRDKHRVLKRVQTDPSADFAKISMISLIEARDAVDDERLWVSSGADEFVNGFLSLVDNIAQGLNVVPPSEAGTSESVETGRVKPRRPIRKKFSRQGSALDPNAPESFTPKFS